MRFLRSPWFHILLDCEDSLSDTVCLCNKQGPNLWLNCHFFYEREMIIFLQCLCNNFVSVSVLEILLPSLHGTTQTCWPTPCLARILLNLQYFSNHWSMQVFFAFGICLDILINVLEDYITFLIWVAWVLFTFYLGF